MNPRLALNGVGTSKVIRSIVILFICSVLAGCTQLFFVPDSRIVQTPDEIGYEYADVFPPTTDGVRLHSWLIQPKLSDGEPIQGIVYFLHGNAQNISWHYHSVRWLLDAGFAVYAIDYRGYGRSTGIPDVPEVYNDISAGFRWLTEQPQFLAATADDKPRVLFGQSLGASLGLNWLAQEEPAQKLFTHMIADSGFASFSGVARETANSHWITWLFQLPAQWFLSDERDPVDSIETLTLPILLVHSEDDTVVRHRHSDALLAAGGDQVKRLSAQGPHIAAFRSADIRNSTLEWLAK